VPLVVGYVGGHAGGSKPRAFLHSQAFVLGLATTFAELGAAAALLGQIMAAGGYLVWLA
jgi:cytochrome c biogenesis protein CcdA